MQNRPMNRTKLIVVVLGISLLAAGPAWAQGKKPKKEEPKKESSSGGLKKAENNGNKALDSVEKGVKEGASAVVTGGNKALQAVDDTIHGRK